MLSIMGNIVSDVEKLTKTVADPQKAQNLQIHISNSNPLTRPSQSSILGVVRELYDNGQ